jgi:hypothetical protein
MSRQKLITLMIVALFLAGIGVSQGLAYVHSTVAAYEHSCGTLSGFPGFLQAVGFFAPAGDCVTKADGSCQNTGSCTIKNPPSGASQTGRCTTEPTGKNKFTCKCQ